jgi:hypothetical protein
MVECGPHFTNHERKHPHLGNTKLLVELRVMRVRADKEADRHVSHEVTSRFFLEQSRKVEKKTSKCVMAKRGSPEHRDLRTLTNLNEFTG